VTDTPAEVAEALERVDFDCPSAGVTLRDYIANLERQLAEARGELAAKDEAYRLQFEACAQLAAQRERDGRDADYWRELVRRAWWLLDLECPNHPLVDELLNALTPKDRRP
jgi:sRNA-binding protein